MSETVWVRLPRRPFPMLPVSASVVFETFGLEFAPTWTPVGFTLQRTKGGTEIGLQHGRFWWNLSALLEIYPPSFKEARKWVAAYAAQHGQEVTELRRDGLCWVSPTRAEKFPERGAEE